MLQLVFRSFFFIAVILGYSTGIWRMINDYFRHEFQTYLEQESQTNKYLLRDPPGVTPPGASNPPTTVSPPLAGSPIVDGGQVFTSGSEPGDCVTLASADHQKVTNSISKLSGTNDARGAGGEAREGTDFQPTVGKGSAGEEIVTDAAEVTDIRPGSRTMPPSFDARGEGSAVVEPEGDKWISYWKERGQGEALQEEDTSANAFCSVGPNPSGAFQVEERQGEEAAAFGCGAG